MASMVTWAGFPLTLAPTDWAVPKISLTVPTSSLAKDFDLISRAMLMISSKGMLPLCLMFFSFFLSLGGSLRAPMTREEADGTTET